MEENDHNLPDSQEVIETELMDNDEVDQTVRDEQPAPGFHYGKVVFGKNPDGSSYTHVETDGNSTTSGMPFGFGKPPVFTTWLCLFISWLFLSSPVPFTVLLGLPLGAFALILAAVCFVRGAVGTGILTFILGTVGSAIVYLVGIVRFIV